MPEQDIHFDLDDGILRITLDRPDAGNSMTGDQREQILEWLDRANGDLAIRCIVLGATGRFFCTGADLRQSGPPPERPEGAPERLVGDLRRNMKTGAIRLVNAILDCEKPVLAAVQGTAAGIGCHIAFACDLVVAAEEAKFVEVFARRGLTADGLGTWLIPRLVGLQRAKEMILLAEDVPAQRAYEIGLVSRVVPAADLDATVMELARKLADGPTRAHATNKFLLNRSLDVDRQTIAEEESWAVDAMSHTHDAEEGVASFVERRPPDFRGY